MALTFCSRCGQSQHAGDASHYVDACAHAKPVPQSVLAGVDGVRCPIEGCKWHMKPDGRPVVRARAQFDLHLEWHAQNGVFGKVGPSAREDFPAVTWGKFHDSVLALISAAEQHLLLIGAKPEEVEVLKRIAQRVRDAWAEPVVPREVE